MEVTVALVGDPADPWAIPDWDRPLVAYQQLPKMSLEVEAGGDEQLLSVLERASHQFGVTMEEGSAFIPSWVAFYREEDESGYTRHHDTTVTLVDDVGRAVWNVYFADAAVTMSALVRAGDAGALDGDPLRPYLTLEPPYGNGWLPDWNQVLVGWVILREVLGVLADGHGAVSAIAGGARRVKRLLDRFREVPDVVERHHQAWTAHQGWPHDVGAFVDRQPWASDVLATLLGCSTAEAESFLRGRGFSYDPQSALWQLPSDDETLRLRRIIDYVYSLHIEDDPAEDEEAVRARFELKIIEELGREDPPAETD